MRIPRSRSRQHQVTATRNGRWRGLVLLLWILGMAQAASGQVISEAQAGGASDPNPAARLPGGGSASEYWDLTVRLDSGHVVAARFIITNEGFGDQNGVALGHLVQPDGSKVAFRNGKTRSRWRLTGGDRNLDIGGCHLFMEERAYRFWINKDAVKINLHFEANVSLDAPDSVMPDGYHLNVLAVAVPIEGTLWLPGDAKPQPVAGQASLVHTWMNNAEAQQIQRRVDLYGFDSAPAYGVVLRTPPGDQTQWFVARREDGSWFSTDSFQAHLEGSLPGIRRKGYPAPESINFDGPHLKGDVKLTQTALEADPLGGVAFPLRWMLSRGMRPHRVWAHLAFDVTLPPNSTSPPQLLQGPGIAAVTYLNPNDHH